MSTLLAYMDWVLKQAKDQYACEACGRFPKTVPLEIRRVVKHLGWQFCRCVPEVR